MSHTVLLTAPIKDLKVSIQQSNYILPFSSSIANQKSMFLSNIDQHADIYVRTLHFFTSNPDFSTELVVERLKGAVSESLGPFNFLAGRLKWNAELRRLEIDCNDPIGVGFVVAESEYALEEVGDLTYPHPAFEQLVALDMRKGDDKLLLNLQVTVFRCGSFSMGITNNHVTMDGKSFKIYLQSLGTLAANKPLTLTPCNDRYLLAARSPPQIIPFHNKLPMPSKPLDLSEQPHPAVVKVFKLSASDIVKLIDKLTKSDQFNKDTKESSNRLFSRFNVITALIWKCKALVNSKSSSTKDQDWVSTIHYPVDIRNRLQPPLPQSYIGNAVCLAQATPSTCEELKNYCSFRKVVESVAEGGRKITDEYVRCFLHMSYADKELGGLYGECMVTNWCNLGFERVEYPWGKPKYYCPLDYRRKDSVVMFPGMQNEVGCLTDIDRGVNIFVAQSSSEEMGMFERHFHELLRA